MAIHSLESLYACYPSDTPDGKIAREVIVQSDWLYNSVEFDPMSGDALPQSLSHFLTRLQSSAARETLHDRLWRIVEFSAGAFVRIIRSLNEQPRTDYARMHVSKVREMDASSFVKLANRTGRTIREKLGSDPFVTSVRHFQSVDILENRLLKAYALRMEELLESRAKAFDEPESDLLVDIRNWLVSDDAKSISRWDNLPPNNALLSHRDYRRIWKAWRWLQSLDEDVSYDADHVADHRRIVSFWDRLAQAFAGGSVIADMPISFDYDTFYIGAKVSGDIIYAKNASCRRIEIGDCANVPVGSRRSGNAARRRVDRPVCIDFSSLKPMWTTGRDVNHLDALLVWQRWAVEGVGFVPVLLSDAICVWINDNVSTVTMRDLILPGRVESEVSERAASEFLSILRERFCSPELVWLVPDCVNEFELSVLRRHINNQFDCAQPLPRSIATVMEKVDGRKIRDGYAVTVLDALGGMVYATKLVARKSSDVELLERVPESRGYYWERQPTVVFTNQEWSLEDRLAGVDILDGNQQWHSTAKDRRLENPIKLKRQFLDTDDRFVGSEVVFAGDDPVVGGLLLHERQKKAGGIPLWRDHLPDLDLSASSGTEMLRVHLVSNTTIVPRTGLTFEIPVEATFTLPAGRDVYTFPLFQGAGVARLRYQARLSARDVFPLKDDLPCKLLMRYTYGADNPYELRFLPKVPRPNVPTSFLVEWVPVTAEMFRGPDFPVRRSYAAINDLIVKLRRGLDRLRQYSAFLQNAPSQRKYVELNQPLEWREGRDGRLFSFLSYEGTKIFVYSGDYEEFNRDALELSFDKVLDSHGYRALNITIGETIPRNRWAHSLLMTVLCLPADIDAVQSLRVEQLVKEIVDAAEGFCNQIGVDLKTRVEILSVIASYNTRVVREDILGCANNLIGVDLFQKVVEGSSYEDWQRFNSYKKAIALSFGDCSTPWELEIIEHVLEKLRINEKWASVVYEILSIAMWRSKSLIHRFDRASLVEILEGLGPAIKKDCARVNGLAVQPNRANGDHRLDAALNTLCKHLELLLALLRTRESDNEDIRRMTMPGTPNAVNFEAIVGDEVIPLFKRGLWFESRIRLDLNKPEMFRESPDLLYALKLYLTGDDGANSIIVSGISEED